MGRGERGRGRGERGGIAELRQIIEEHGAALEYDLLTKTRYQLRDVGGALPWGALFHFVQFLPRDSALAQDVRPTSDAERWVDGTLVAPLIADLIDTVNAVGSSLMAKGTGRHPRTTKPYPRPWATGHGEQRYGSEAIPIAEFDSWWDSAGPRERSEVTDDAQG